MLMQLPALGGCFRTRHTGCELVMLERSPVIAALLRNGLERALADLTRPPRSAQDAAALWRCHRLPERAGPPQKPQVIEYGSDVSPSKSALVKRRCLFRRLVGEDADSAELLSAARRHARHRVVVKRPAGAAWVGMRSRPWR